MCGLCAGDPSASVRINGNIRPKLHGSKLFQFCLTFVTQPFSSFRSFGITRLANPYRKSPSTNMFGPSHYILIGTSNMGLLPYSVTKPFISGQPHPVHFGVTNHGTVRPQRLGNRTRPFTTWTILCRGTTRGISIYFL